MANQEPNLKLPPVRQIGIVVEDVDKATDYCTSHFGWGPFRVDNFQMEGAIFRGRPKNLRTRAAFTTHPGPIEIELLQVLEADADIREFFWSKGGGLHHLLFMVDDLDGILVELAKEGIEPVLHHDLPVAKLAFVEIDKVGGVYYELVEVKSRASRQGA